jgi:hypothetical protein
VSPGTGAGTAETKEMRDKRERGRLITLICILKWDSPLNEIRMDQTSLEDFSQGKEVIKYFCKVKEQPAR